MYSGFGRRNEPHSERKYYAVQVIEPDYVTSDLIFIASDSRATL
jgi:hypothetical protein